MAEALLVGAPDEEQVTVPSGGYNPGKILLAPSGRPGVVQGQRPLEEGEVATVKTTLKYAVASASATVFALGALVDWDDTNKLAVAHGLGDWTLGPASKAKASGQLTVEVLFGEADEKTRVDNTIADPGDAGAIPVNRSGYVPLVSAGAETRTLADPTFIGQQLLLSFKADGGDIVITAASPVNQTGNTVLTFADIGDMLQLIGCADGADIEWRVVANDGVALSTPV